jgi:hypothetical protein
MCAIGPQLVDSSLEGYKKHLESAGIDVDLQEDTITKAGNYLLEATSQTTSTPAQTSSHILTINSHTRIKSTPPHHHHHHHG